MSGWLKDDLTVALDEVDRTASRMVTIHEDLGAIAVDSDAARRLHERGERLRRALVSFNHARQAAGQTPEVGDPERAHLTSLWLALKSAVAGDHSEESLQDSLADLDEALHQAVDTARGLNPPDLLVEALDGLAAELHRPV